MRIIAGDFKGKKLYFPNDHYECRPTQDRIKEAMFSILQDRISGSQILDLFAGSGNLGFESLSRGASHVTLVDIDPVYCFKNRDHLGLKGASSLAIIKKKASHFLARTTLKADVIFLDPPWSKETLFEDSLKGIFDFDILSSRGVIVCDHPKYVSCENDLFYCDKTYHYGRKKITILCHHPKKK